MTEGGVDVTGKTHYALRPGIRARREKFGLLFYDSRTTGMTFVRSGGSLDVVRGDAGTLVLVVRPGAAHGEKQIERLMDVLAKKGLVDGAGTGI